jgi:3-oxoacyl-[acyl-carrier protein] reductase
MKLKDKVAIVTGGGRGIGRAYALRFSEEGAKVVIADIALDNAQKAADEIKATGGETLALHTDVSSRPSTEDMAKKTVEQFGKIDILVNNAAIYYGIGMNRWDSWAPEDWDRMFAVNVKGSWLCIKAAAPFMIAQGKGKIINISSNTVQTGLEALLPYTCSKGATIALTRVMARALGRHNICVNCISPGYTMSEASIEMPGKVEGMDKLATRGRCFRREEEPDDLAGTAVYLASEDSDFITGQTIVVDGGEVLL